MNKEQRTMNIYVQNKVAHCSLLIAHLNGGEI